MAQDMVLAGGMLTVSAGTQVRIEAPLTWQLAPGAAVVNHGLIDFGAQGSLVEQAGSPITGTGIETAQWAPTAPLVDAEPGGLGLTLSTAYAGGDLRVERGHVPRETALGETSVARWYRVSTHIPTSDALLAAIRIDTTELNGIAPNVLGLYHSADGQTWVPTISSIDLPSLTISGQTPAPEILLTAFDSEVVTRAFSTSAGDSWGVAPTLVDDWVRIESRRGRMIESLDLLDGHGRLVLRENPMDRFAAGLGMAGLPAGPYVVLINGGQGVFKLMKR